MYDSRSRIVWERISAASGVFGGKNSNENVGESLRMMSVMCMIQGYLCLCRDFRSIDRAHLRPCKGSSLNSKSLRQHSILRFSTGTPRSSSNLPVRSVAAELQIPAQEILSRL